MSNPMETLPAKVIDALRKGNKIEAIKLLREVRSLGLAEAKNFVEWHLQRDPKIMRNPDEARTLPPARAAAAGAAPKQPHYTPRPGLSPGEVPKGGGGPAAAFAILMAVAVAVAAYFLLN